MPGLRAPLVAAVEKYQEHSVLIHRKEILVWLDSHAEKCRRTLHAQRFMQVLQHVKRTGQARCPFLPSPLFPPPPPFYIGQ